MFYSLNCDSDLIVDDDTSVPQMIVLYFANFQSELEVVNNS